MVRKIFLFLFMAAGTITASDWGYDKSAVMPQDWGSLPGYELCSQGKTQSPIDFSRTEQLEAKDLMNIDFSYKKSSLNMIHNGHTVEIEYQTGSTIRLSPDGPVYELVQFHFHAPSEHAFKKDSLFDIEMHLVHRQRDNPSHIAVVAVIIQEGKTNESLQPLWDHLKDVQQKEDEYRNENVVISAADFLPEDKRYFAYKGSLTTPPCSEGVEWRVLIQPIEMSEEQIQSFTSVLNGNNRPLQNLNDRLVQRDTTN